MLAQSEGRSIQVTERGQKVMKYEHSLALELDFPLQLHS
jgi:predicted urease superfamily metal-dependent hydrolase